MTSRRRFLKEGAIGAIGAGLALGLGHRVIDRGAFASAASSFDLNRAAFASQLHTTFLVKDGARKIPLTLIDVIDYGSKKTLTRDREAFALVLRGTNFSPLGQETYEMEHEKLGRFSLLVVPILAQDKKARYYEININRLHS